MKVNIEQPDGSWKTEERAPECGSFCDTCGDCMYCFGEDPCTDGGAHTWVIYDQGCTNRMFKITGSRARVRDDAKE